MQNDCMVLKVKGFAWRLALDIVVKEWRGLINFEWRVRKLTEINACMRTYLKISNHF